MVGADDGLLDGNEEGMALMVGLELIEGVALGIPEGLFDGAELGLTVAAVGAELGLSEGFIVRDSLDSGRTSTTAACSTTAANVTVTYLPEAS